MTPLTLTLICHASTQAVREAAFPADEPLDREGRAKAAAMAAGIRRIDAAWSAPELRARQTADALGLDAAVDEALREVDYGSWAGRSLAAVAAADPTGAAAWLADASAAPHGGESVACLVKRVSAWLAAVQDSRGKAAAVSHASVLRAAIVTVLDAEPRSFWRVEIGPLGRVRLRSSGGRWTLVSIGR